MIKNYNLEKEGMQFKSDFNWNFELLSHIFELRTKSGYFKIDLIQSKESKKVYLSKRKANFKENNADFELKDLR